MKYAIPTDDGSTVSPVFGRAQRFALFGDDGMMSIVDNAGANSEHGAGTGAAAFLAERGVGAVMTPEVGPKAADALKTAGISVKPVRAGGALTDVVSATLKKA